MKNKGFTLAEVLITLGIIGVISALTLPTFTQKTSGAKIGPQLAKAVSTYEQAAKAVLAEEDTDSLLAAADNTTDLINKMGRYMNGGVDTRDPIFTLKDGVSYYYKFQLRTPSATDSKYAKEVPLVENTKTGLLTIDLNGSAGPNQYGRDRFAFTPWADGSLRAKGARDWYTWNKSGQDSFDDSEWWGASEKCPDNRKPGDATYCAGSIFENGLQVMYK